MSAEQQPSGRRDAARRNDRSRARRGRAGGFTLLEVLLTTILAATLLAALWALLDIYLRLFETGRTRAEQSQLVGSLMQQFRDDFQSAIEDGRRQGPAAGSSQPGGRPATVRRFGLLGSRHALRLDVLEVIPLEETPPLDTDVSDGFRRAPTPQVPELQTVLYRFEDPSGIREDDIDVFGNADPVPRPGLTRRELDFETPYAPDDDSPPGGLLAGPATTTAGPSGHLAAAGSPLEQLLATGPGDESLTWVPEVAALEFRYFDGSGWSSEWNSLDRKSLPAAIEVAIQVRPLDEVESGRALDNLERAGDEWAGDEWEGDEGDELDAARQTAGPPTGPQRPTYRLVIDLPGAKSHPAVRRPPPRSGPVLATPPVARPVPRYRPPPLPGRRIPAPPPRPDQWMRAER